MVVLQLLLQIAKQLNWETEEQIKFRAGVIYLNNQAITIVQMLEKFVKSFANVWIQLDKCSG